jgi:hypothetical protein
VEHSRRTLPSIPFARGAATSSHRVGRATLGSRRQSVVRCSRLMTIITTDTTNPQHIQAIVPAARATAVLAIVPAVQTGVLTALEPVNVHFSVNDSRQSPDSSVANPSADSMRFPRGFQRASKTARKKQRRSDHLNPAISRFGARASLSLWGQDWLASATIAAGWISSRLRRPRDYRAPRCWFCPSGESSLATIEPECLSRAERTSAAIA